MVPVFKSWRILATVFRISWVSMVVNVCLTGMLLFEVHVRLVRMRECGMVVLMAMRGCEMDPLFARTLVVGHMPVLVCMDKTIMMVLSWHP
jgi:hypothetical protein